LTADWREISSGLFDTLEMVVSSTYFTVWHSVGGRLSSQWKGGLPGESPVGLFPRFQPIRREQTLHPLLSASEEWFQPPEYGLGDVEIFQLPKQ
jgi:hypothetical protein